MAEEKVANLGSGSRGFNLIIKALNKEEPREVISKKDGRAYKVSEVLVGDDTGTILLTLWDENITLVEKGKNYLLENAYTTVFGNSLRLNIGKFGKISQSAKEVEVKTENAVSEKHFEARFRRRYYGEQENKGVQYRAWMK
jgi:replication factor A1